MLRCPGCGEENPDRFRLCGYCGSVLVAQPPPQEVRKTVTVVFCDLVGSTALGERSDPEVLRGLMGRYHAELRAILERHDVDVVDVPYRAQMWVTRRRPGPAPPAGRTAAAS